MAVYLRAERRTYARAQAFHSSKGLGTCVCVYVCVCCFLAAQDQAGPVKAQARQMADYVVACYVMLLSLPDFHLVLENFMSRVLLRSTAHSVYVRNVM